MDFELFCVNVSSSVVNKYTSLLGSVDNRGGFQVQGQGEYGKSGNRPSLPFLLWT